jgi:tetratricopeptide (TPR) repeat protein
LPVVELLDQGSAQDVVAESGAATIIAVRPLPAVNEDRTLPQADAGEQVDAGLAEPELAAALRRLPVVELPEVQNVVEPEGIIDAAPVAHRLSLPVLEDRFVEQRRGEGGSQQAVVEPIVAAADWPLPAAEATWPSWASSAAGADQIRRLPDAGNVLEDRRAAHGPSAEQHWAAAEGALVGVAQQAQESVHRACELARKGAIYSARAEFLEALRAIAASLDAHYSDGQHTAALVAALRALKEADDFAVGESLEAARDVETIRSSHRTEVLSAEDSRQVSPMVAMQRYYEFAQEQLVMAAGGAPVAADAYYGLGKLYLALGEPTAVTERMHGPKAMAFFAAALDVNPSHATAANELGVAYARLGKWQEARRVLQRSVAVASLPENWHNLSVVHERLGELELAAQARQQWQRLAGAQRSAMPANGLVQWVEPAALAGGGQSTPPRPATTPATRTAREEAPKWRWSW